ncbi:MAG: ABC-type transport auxiliary lipoprotein family protein [Campylobacterota bacterium]|nr:ABC-type transport auxiliary lipoprotein family protein [Campylobacterota bacterium]
MKYILILSIVLLFSGCSIVKEPLTEYQINVKVAPTDINVNRCNDKSIKVLQSFSSVKLKTLNMNYIQGENKVYTYSKSMWSDSPNSAVTSEVVKLLKDSNLFKNVQISRSRAKSDFILETNIENFIQYFSNELNSSYVVVAITFTIIDAKTNLVISSKSFKARKDSKTLDADGGVEALNRALNNILIQSSYWFKEVCR